MINLAIYKPVPLTKRSFLQKLFKQHPAENAVKEVNNLLATQPLLQITRQDIEVFERNYQVNLLQEYALNLEEFYAVYLASCLDDRVFTQDESSELMHLQAILGLPDKNVKSLREKIGTDVYRKAFEEAVAGGRLTKENERALVTLAASLQIPQAIADAISKDTRHQVVEKYIALIKAKARLCPADEKELTTMAESLSVDLKIHKDNLILLGKLKKYWELENLPLETIATDIPLQKGEACFLSVKKVQWREGTKLVDSGVLCLTNKRILLAGLQKNSNVRLEKILNAATTRDGIFINKDAGKNPTLVLPQYQDEFLILLDRLRKGS